MGDKILEQLMTLEIKNMFFRPFLYRSPIENNFYIGRTFADLMDRHYALFANNQHPLQLNAYEAYNKYLRDVHDQGQADWHDDLEGRLDRIQEEKK
jgi:hypothetical protein